MSFDASNYVEEFILKPHNEYDILKATRWKPLKTANICTIENNRHSLRVHGGYFLLSLHVTNVIIMMTIASSS